MGTAGLQPANAFVQAIGAGVDYWQRRTQGLGDDGLRGLDEERHNLHRAVRFGLALSQTWRATAEVVLQTVPLADQFAAEVVGNAWYEVRRQDPHDAQKALNRATRLAPHVVEPKRPPLEEAIAKEFTEYRKRRKKGSSW